MSKLFATGLLLGLLLAPAFSSPSASDTRKDPPPDFKGDGCSWFPDGDYRDCCFAHDKEYFRGGTEAERRAADGRLYLCVRSKGHKILAPLMWAGVRLGGAAFLPTSFRWGFGQENARKK